MTADVNRRVLPGFSLSLGYTLLYMGLLIGIPLAAGFLKASQLSLGAFWAAVSSDRAVAAYTLTVGASFASAFVSALLGLLVAWVLVRYDFPLKPLSASPAALPPPRGPPGGGWLLSACLVRAKGLAGRLPRPAGPPGRLPAAGLRAGARLHRVPLRGPHARARAAGPRRRRGGGGGLPGSEPAADRRP